MKYIFCHCGCKEKIPAINKAHKLAKFKHNHHLRGKNHHHFKGRIKRGLYWYILKKDHPFSGKQGYVAEHRLIMEKKIGRYLKKEEVVHHINSDPSDNRIKNLILFKTHGQHTKIGHPEIYEKQKILFKGKNFSPDSGFKKGMTSWNKGIPCSEETRKKISQTKKNQYASTT